MSVSDLADSPCRHRCPAGVLRQGHWTPYAVARSLWRAAERSLRQAARRPRALIQLTVLHGLLLALTGDRRPGGRWVATSWTLGVLHLGLLEHREQLAPADALTLIRANLPALPGGRAEGPGCWRSPWIWPTADWPGTGARCPPSASTPTLSRRRLLDLAHPAPRTQPHGTGSGGRRMGAARRHGHRRRRPPRHHARAAPPRTAAPGRRDAVRRCTAPPGALRCPYRRDHGQPVGQPDSRGVWAGSEPTDTRSHRFAQRAARPPSLRKSRSASVGAMAAARS